MKSCRTQPSEITARNAEATRRRKFHLWVVSETTANWLRTVLAFPVIRAANWFSSYLYFQSFKNWILEAFSKKFKGVNSMLFKLSFPVTKVTVRWLKGNVDGLASVKYGNLHIVFCLIFIENIFIYFNKNLEPLNETLEFSELLQSCRIWMLLLLIQVLFFLHFKVCFYSQV